MRVEAFGTSDIGCRRQRNEDHLVVLPQLIHNLSLAVVADGVGAEAGGGTASRMFTELLVEGIQEHLEAFAAYTDLNDRAQRDHLLHALKHTLSSINYDLYARRQLEPGLIGSTTGLVALVVEAGIFIAHAGDCRAYLLRQEQTYQLTADHTFAQRLLDEGTLAPNELQDFPYKNVVTRAFGREPVIEVDTLFVSGVGGDRLILCSDGLHNLVPWEDLGALAALFPEPRSYAEHLIAEANRRGGHDNISVAVLDLHGEPAHRPLDLHRKLDLLRGMFLFQGLTDPELMKVLRCVYEQRFEPHAPIIAEGTEGHEIFLLAEGIADVSLQGAYLTSIAAGGHFGELALIDDGFRSASVTARHACHTLTIHREDFAALLSDDPLLATKLLSAFLRNVAGRVRDLSHDLADLRAQQPLNAEAG